MDHKCLMTAIILAGGKSSRMGQDKALLKFGEKTNVEHLVSLLEPIFSEILIIVDRRAKLGRLDLGGAEIYEDLIRDHGPLAAMYTGLFYSSFKASCVLTCDMPFIDEVIIHDLLDFWKQGFDVICFEDPYGNDQPFPGIYRRSSRFLIRSLLERGENSMKWFLEVADVKSIVFERERMEVLTNMNHMEDYHHALKRKEQFE